MDITTDHPVLLPSSSPPHSSFIHHSIETDYPDSGRTSSGPDDEAVFDTHPSTRHSSPHTSSESESDISSLPTDSRAPSYDVALSRGSDSYKLNHSHGHSHRDSYNNPRTSGGNNNSYTPRSPFRNPSSVRAIQLSTTPPHLASPSSHRSRHRYRMTTPSTRSLHSQHSHHSHHSHSQSPTRSSTPRSHISHLSHSPPKPAPRKEHPLVLLHVTLLPVAPPPYPRAVLERALPAHVLASWKLLETKLADATIRERGVLIPHPREEYEELEERLLESLELVRARVGRCGHFLGRDDDKAVLDDEERTDEDAGVDTEQDPSDIPEDAETCTLSPHTSVCPDCTRHIDDGLGGVGTGSHRWDVKIYAANGLMRAGAWVAAWREMERVDVEIRPWMEPAAVRELERVVAEAAEEELLLHEHELRNEDDDDIDMELHMAMEQERNAALHDVHAAASPSPSPKMDAQRRREIYGEATPREEEAAELDAHDSRPTGTDTFDFATSHVSPTRKLHATRKRDVPLPELLKNYIALLLRDGRNIALVLLSVLVVFLAVRGGGTKPASEAGALEHARAVVGSASGVHGVVESVRSAGARVQEILPSVDGGSVTSFVGEAVAKATNAVERAVEGVVGGREEKAVVNGEEGSGTVFQHGETAREEPVVAGSLAVDG